MERFERMQSEQRYIAVQWCIKLCDKQEILRKHNAHHYKMFEHINEEESPSF